MKGQGNNIQGFYSEFPHLFEIIFTVSPPIIYFQLMLPISVDMFPLILRLLSSDALVACVGLVVFGDVFLVKLSFPVGCVAK